MHRIRMQSVIRAALLVFAVAALPAWATQTSSERADLARYQKYAQAPVDHVHYYQINGFQYLAPDKVAVWFGVNKLYLLTVQTPCPDLGFTGALGLTAQNQNLYKNFDFVTFGHRRCKIVGITPVDELQMKKDEAKVAGASG